MIRSLSVRMIRHPLTAWLGLWMATTLVIFLPLLVRGLFPEISTVYRTGVCPGLPPDGGPWPCGILEYIVMVALSPFALAAYTLMAFVSSLAASLVVGALFTVRLIWVNLRGVTERGQTMPSLPFVLAFLVLVLVVTCFFGDPSTTAFL